MAIPNKKSIAVVWVSNANAAVDVIVPIPDSSFYTKFVVDIPADTTQATLQADAGGGFKNLFAQAHVGDDRTQITCEPDGAVTMFELSGPMKGGIQLVCRSDDAGGVSRTIFVTMSGSAYSLGAPKGA